MMWPGGERTMDYHGQARRRLSKYARLTGTDSYADVRHLIDHRRRAALRLKKAARIESRAIGIWVGITFEVAIHLFITSIETVVLEAYSAAHTDTNASDEDGHHDTYVRAAWTRRSDAVLVTYGGSLCE